jgi:PTH1 family peptidyl-tRNA hydrolase
VLIAGLGNPGESYSDTRHNAGFRALDCLFLKHKDDVGISSWKHDSKNSVEICDLIINKEINSIKKRISHKLVKPLLYMNRSGDPIKRILTYYKDLFDEDVNNFDLQNDKSKLSGEKGVVKKFLPLIVVHDELDFEPGVVKVKTSGSAGGHNGVSDVIRSFGRDDFIRIRIGIGHPRNSKYPDMTVSDWVLGKPRGEEFDKVESGVLKAAEIIDQILNFGVHKIKYAS